MHQPGRSSLAALAVTMLAGNVALAGGKHDNANYSFGEPGTAAEVTRTVEVIADDRGVMEFVMEVDPIRMGEVIRFVVMNHGTQAHEFSIGDTASQRAHAKLMARNPDMKHEGDPTTVHLMPGETKELIWKFNEPVKGDIVFACHLKDHFDSGMAHVVEFDKDKKVGSS
jgi:uncharacterized cupredoxin-like copper-binding protein